MGRKRGVEIVEWIHDEHQDMIIRTTQSPLFMNIDEREINIKSINEEDRSNQTLQIKMCKIRLKNTGRKPYIGFVMSKVVNGTWYDIVPDSEAEDGSCVSLTLKPHEENTDKSNRFYLIHKDAEGNAIESMCLQGYFLKADHESKSLCMIKRKPLRGSKRQNSPSSYHLNEKFQFVDLSKIQPPSGPNIPESDIHKPSSKPKVEDVNIHQPFDPKIEVRDIRRPTVGPEIENRYVAEIGNTDDHNDNDDNYSTNSDTEGSIGGNEINLPTPHGKEDIEEETSNNKYDKTEEILNIADFFNDGDETPETATNTRRILAVIQALARVFITCLRRNNSERDEN